MSIPIPIKMSKQKSKMFTDSKGLKSIKSKAQRAAVVFIGSVIAVVVILILSDAHVTQSIFSTF
jgi:hypothetical protein